ncbi:MAG: response regulator [Archangium sp.]|nr:response regulator [Archangium sp.]
MSRIWSFIDRLAGASASEPEHARWRGRFITTLMLLGIAASVAVGIGFAVTRQWTQLAVVPSGVMVCGLLLLAWRKWKREGIIANVFAVFATCLYFAGFVVHRELSTIAWLTVMPMLVLFLGGRKLGLVWLGIEVAVIGAAMMVSIYLPAPANLAEELTLPAAMFRMMSLMAVLFVVTFVFDVSAVSVLTRMLEATQAKSRFLANVSHELRTPLNGVLGMAELMQQNELSSAQRERLAVVLQSAQTLRLLIDDVLDVTQLDRGQLQINEGAVSPVDVVRTVQRQLQTLADAKGLSLSVEPLGEPVMLRTDALRLMQIVSNLVANALKFTVKGGVTVVVQTALEGSQVRLVIEVRDTGPGIDARDVSALFKPFSRLTKDVGVPGTGLGLSIVKTIGELLGGETTLRSELGVGSTFRFELVRPRAIVTAETPIPTVVAIQGPRVLLIDDNAVNLKVARGLLEKLGCQVLTAGDGAAGAELFQRGKFDLVLMDLHMPVMDGFESAKQIRAMDSEVKIIALSATTVREELDAVERSGMNGYLSKPVRLEQLREVLPVKEQRRTA